MNKQTRERGYALVIVMGALVFAAVMAMTFQSAQSTTVAVQQNVDRHAKARAIAEAGLESVIHYVQTSETFRDDRSEGLWLDGQAFADGTFTVYGYDGYDENGDGIIDSDGSLSDDASDPMTLVVVGTYDGVTHEVRVTVTPGVVESVAEGNLVLMVGSSSMHAQDQAKLAQFQAWGWSVVTLVDTASSAEYAAALADAAVIYVSEEVYSSDVASRLSMNTTIGIVNEETHLNDDLEVSSSSWGNTSSSQIDIVDNTHSITSHLSSGVTQVYTSSNRVIYRSGSLAPGAQVLAERVSSSSAALAIIDAGAELADGSTAAGRRVALPFGSNSFDFNKLNNDGLEIIRKSLEWAASGAAVSVPTPISYWGLDELAGSSADDDYSNHDGTIYDGVTLGQTGRVSNAFTFDGSSGHVEVPHHDDYLLDDGTVSFWFYAEDTSGHQAMLSKDSSGYDTGGHLHIYLNGSTLTVRFQDTSSSHSLTETGIVASTWYHVAFTFGSNGAELYLNGELVDTDSHTGGMGTTSGGSGNYEPMVFGAGTWSSGNLTKNSVNYYFNGSMDAIGLYGEQLNAAQIAALHEGASPQTTTAEAPQLIALYEFIEPNPVTPNLVGHWELDETVFGGGGVALGDRIELENDAYIDSYDASQGTYASQTPGSAAVVITTSTGNDDVTLDGDGSIHGSVWVGVGGSTSSVINIDGDGGITGTQAALTTAYSVPAAYAPSGMPGSQGNTTYDDENVTWSSDLRFSRLTIKGGSVVTVTGHVRVQVTSQFELDDSTIQINPGGSLELYANHNVTLKNDAAINPNTAAPERFTLYQYGSNKDVELEGDNVIVGTLYVSRDLMLNNDSEVYGQFFVEDDIKLEGDGGMHLDISLSPLLGMAIADASTGDNEGQTGGSPSVNQSGVIGTAFGFDGNDDYIVIPHGNDYLLDQGTVSFWFKPDDLSGHQGLFSKDSNGYDTGGHLHIYLDGSMLKVRLQRTNGSTTLGYGGSITAGNWHHAAIVFGPDGLKMFLNGTQVQQSSYATTGLGTSSGGVGNYEPIVLGANTWNSGDLTHLSLKNYYDGHLDDVRIYDMALDESQIGEVMAGNALASNPSAIVADTSGFGDPLDLTIDTLANTAWVPGGGLTILDDVTIASPSAASKLYDALTANDELTIEAIFIPDNLTQDGPARIVSYSDSTSARNFTLGQTDADYGLRLRTTSTSSNGLPETTAGATIDTTAQHIIATYDGSEVRLYRNGVQDVATEVTGDFSWSSDDPFQLANEASGDRPWHGTLTRIAIYDRAVNDVQAQRVFNGDAPGDPGGGEDLVFTRTWIERP